MSTRAVTEAGDDRVEYWDALRVAWAHRHAHNPYVLDNFPDCHEDAREPYQPFDDRLRFEVIDDVAC